MSDYYPDYLPGIPTPHAIMFESLFGAAHCSVHAVVNAQDACYKYLQPMPPQQIAFELRRLREMLSRFGGACAAEQIMLRFVHVPAVLEALDDEFDGYEPALMAGFRHAAQSFAARANKLERRKLRAAAGVAAH